MSGDFPPSSSDTRLRFPAEAVMIFWPVKCEPVNAILSTPACAASAAPAVSPNPGTTFTTPGGTPASNISSPRRNGVSGASSAGLRMILQPADNPGPIFHTEAPDGPFHGRLARPTPTRTFNG